tara:strand:- start:901 stop:1131 length:231 start_codon:yes stop_codon:yes gene_type:complete
MAKGTEKMYQVTNPDAGDDNSFGGSLGNNDLQYINVAKAKKQKAHDLSFFDWLDLNLPKKKSKGFYEWLDEQLVRA